MIAGVGVDVVDVERVGALGRRWGERFLGRMFGRDELNGVVGVEGIAGRIAAKEAVMKVLRTGRGAGVAWQDIAILGRGPLTVRLKSKAEKAARRLGICDIMVSISHEKRVAVAVAIGIKRSFLEAGR